MYTDCRDEKGVRSFLLHQKKKTFPTLFLYYSTNSLILEYYPYTCSWYRGPTLVLVLSTRKEDTFGFLVLA